MKNILVPTDFSDKQKKFEVKNIVFASNFEEDVHQAFHKTIEFADLMNAQIHLI